MTAGGRGNASGHVYVMLFFHIYLCIRVGEVDRELSPSDLTATSGTSFPHASACVCIINNDL
jgi:hypothetical protein